jgi:hypothetical protein
MTALDESPHSLPLNELARSCAQQTLLFFQRLESDTRYCFEIFRRAIVEKDQQAWTLLHELYHDQLQRWVRRHPSFTACHEDEAYFASRALEKFWQAVPPAQFARFPDLKYLLSYLQMCVNSAIGEHVRASARAKYEVDLTEAEDHASDEVVEDGILARKQGKELWRLIVERLNDPKEIRVAYDSFLLDLKPGEIFDRNPGMYESTREIYRIKENILSRLRRDSELLNWVGIKPESRR